MVIAKHRSKAIPMLHLCRRAGTPFGGWATNARMTGQRLSQLLAVLIVIVSVGALALTVCLSVVIILAGGSPARRRNGSSLDALGVGLLGPIMAA